MPLRFENFRLEAVCTWLPSLCTRTPSMEIRFVIRICVISILEFKNVPGNRYYTKYGVGVNEVYTLDFRRLFDDI